MYSGMRSFRPETAHENIRIPRKRRRGEFIMHGTAICALSILAVLLVALPAPFSDAAVYYVRADGGTGLQCTGLSDKPYSGSGEAQPCAWSHPFWALDSGGAWKIHGKDTIIIGPGSYRMGYGAPNTAGWCEAGSSWLCHLPPIPSGSESSPTSILGKGWDNGCPDPPELWGTERADHIINLEGTSYARISCLELTDHSGCVESHSNPEVACNRDSPPFGDWGAAGILASDSRNVLSSDLNVHGFAQTGIWAGRLSDWTVENVRIAGNGWVGWDGDLSDYEKGSSNSGSLIFRKWLVEWNGCAESYPSLEPNNCWAQSAGGYGDGVGTANTGGSWIIEDSVFRYNTSDGLDLLYVRESGSSIYITRTKAYGNAGNQIKTNGPVQMNNSLLIGNCGFFNGQSFTYNVDDCRAGGNALSLSVRKSHAVSVVNTTFAGHGDCLAVFGCDEGIACDGSERLIFQNNILRGGNEFSPDPSDTTCYLWTDVEGFYDLRLDYNIIFDGKQGSYVTGPNDIQTDPLFVNSLLSSFDGRLTSESPAINSGLPVGALGGLIIANDIDLTARPYGTGVDRGAYEYTTGCLNQPVKISGTSNYYTSIQTSYESADSGQIILVQGKTFTESLSLAMNKLITVKGGYNCFFSARSGFSTISNGSLTIKGGTARIENLIIK
jgi:hypothetical protein